MNPKILVAGIGNMFRGDDGFGVEVALQLSIRPLPPGVVVKEFGIRSFDLAYALLNPYDLVILVDTCKRGGKPGSVYLIEPDEARFEAHGINAMKVLRMVKSMEGAPNLMVVVGCEPAGFGTDQEDKLGLSEPVAAAVEEAVNLIERLVSQAPRRELAGAASQMH